MTCQKDGISNLAKKETDKFNQKSFTPIFIIGAARSGTTMMNRVLNNSLDIIGLNELHYLGDQWNVRYPLKLLDSESAIKSASVLIKNLRRGVWYKSVSKSEVQQARELISTREKWDYRNIFISVLLNNSGWNGERYIVDQTPKNVLFVDDIIRVFPNAKFIHMMRDPRAILYSQRNRWKKKWRGNSNMPLKNVMRLLSNYHPYTLTSLWKRSAEKAIRYEHDSNYKVVVFEKFCENPEVIMRDICEFLGVGFSEEMLLVPNVGSSNKKHDSSKLGISSDVINEWNGRLPKGDIYLCEHMASNLMKTMGYSLVSEKSWIVNTVSTWARFPIHLAASALLNPGVLLVKAKGLFTDVGTNR